jgi:GNAT superfamily N-acetyltransferase
VLLRRAEPEDALAVASVHVRSWQAGYRGLLPDEYLDALCPEHRISAFDFSHRNPEKPHTLLAVENGKVIGFATTAPSRDEDLPTHGELCALYVDPECWGRGIGKALLGAARQHLLQSGFGDAFLWVLNGNLRAERFYHADGWSADGQRRTETVWGVDADEVRYRRNLR